MNNQLFYIKQRFNNYEHFNSLIEKYEQSSGYRLSVHDSCKNKEYNPCDDDAKQPEKKETFEFLYKVLKCTKSGTTKSKGKGLRNKVSAKLDCPFFIRIKLTKDKQSLEISKVHLQHTHKPDYDELDTSYNDVQHLFEVEMKEGSMIIDDSLQKSNSNENFICHGIQLVMLKESLTMKNVDSVSKTDNYQDVDNMVNCQKRDENFNSTKKEIKKKENFNEVNNEETYTKQNSEIKDSENQFIDVDETNSNKTEDVGNESKGIHDEIKNVDDKNKNVKVISDEMTTTTVIKKTRGRPKGHAKTAIGLSIKKKEIVPFENLSGKSKLYRILLWLSFPNKIINMILSGESIVKYSNLEEKLKNLSDSFLSTDINIKEFQNYFEPKAFRFFQIAIINLRKAEKYTCKICEELIMKGQESIQCDSCLIWYHTKCAQIKLSKKVLSAKWFCECCNKN